mmetsp:Transcript_19613/g.47904  ORF Transcript_19613/g.47904 Transcript_19613/m.47904 type:complete len:227 (-) Transcript_19613:2771-3451(-)
MMVTLRRGSACSRNQPTTAWPASWYATNAFSWGDITLFFFSSPPITLSVACSKSTNSTASFPVLAAIIAASLHKFAMSAPANPGVRAASLSDKKEILSLSVRGFRWTSNICRLPLMSGLSTRIWRSNRPGRSKALSRMSTLFVPANTTTPVCSLKPSISTRSWLSVFSRSSLPPPKPPLLRLRPTASISSMNTMQGALCRAFANRSRTREGPTPTNISMKSEPDML